MIEPHKAVVIPKDRRRPEPIMSIPRSVADVIRNHLTLEVEGIDRMYLNVYQPKLQTEKQAACFFRYHRGQPVASSALMGVMTHAFLQQVDAFVEAQQIPVVAFKKGQRKDDVAAEQRARFHGTEGVLFLGKAQEKVNVFRTEKLTAPNGKKYPWIVKRSAPVNQFYFYCIDEDFGPFFLKFCTYFPYNAKLCINGHEYVKRQLAKEGIAFEPLDNGVLSCDDPMVQALYSALLVFHLLPRGFSNRELRNHWAPLLGKEPQSITLGQMTYHLRRLRLHGLIARIPKSHRYRLTEEGWRTIMFCNRCYHRVLRPGLAQVLPAEAAPNTILRRRFDQLDAAIDQWLEGHNMAA
jgi:hypothetical protein